MRFGFTGNWCFDVLAGHFGDYGLCIVFLQQCGILYHLATPTLCVVATCALRGPRAVLAVLCRRPSFCAP